MEGVHYELDTETQFWGELDDILQSAVGEAEGNVERVVKNYIAFAAAFRGTWIFCSNKLIWIGEYLNTDESVELCCSKLFGSQLFIRNAERVRYELTRIINEV